MDRRSQLVSSRGLGTLRPQGVAFRIVRRQTGSKKCAAPWLLTTAAPAYCGGQRRQPFGLGGADPGNIESNISSADDLGCVLVHLGDDRGRRPGRGKQAAKAKSGSRRSCSMSFRRPALTARRRWRPHANGCRGRCRLTSGRGGSKLPTICRARRPARSSATSCASNGGAIRVNGCGELHGWLHGAWGRGGAAGGLYQHGLGGLIGSAGPPRMLVLRLAVAPAWPAKPLRSAAARRRTNRSFESLFLRFASETG